MALDTEQLKRLITSWKNKFGEEYHSPNGDERMVVPVNGRARREMYKHLIKTLKDLHGYKVDDFSGQVERLVLDTSINPKAEKSHTWKEIAAKDWADAMDDYFPQPMLEHTAEDEERQEKQPRAPKPTIKREDRPIPSDDFIERPKLDLSIFKDVPKSKSTKDEEFLKLLENGPSLPEDKDE